MLESTISKAAAELGRRGGLVGGLATTPAKKAASAKNGQLGGRPRQFRKCTRYVVQCNDVSPNLGGVRAILLEQKAKPIRAIRQKVFKGRCSKAKPHAAQAPSLRFLFASPPSLHSSLFLKSIFAFWPVETGRGTLHFGKGTNKGTPQNGGTGSTVFER